MLVQFFDIGLYGVASIPMLQTITFIALDGTESTASQNLIWTCGPDPLQPHQLLKS